MAVMFAEAAPEIVAGASSGAGTAAATEAAGGTTGGYFGGVTASPRAASSAAGERRPPGRGARTRPPRSGATSPSSAAAAAAGASVPQPTTHTNTTKVDVDLGVGWHRVVMAEFILAVLILVFAPILTPDESNTGSKGFFKAADIVRLTAICLVFVVLSLMANGQKIGKFAAAFGGLVVAGVLVNNASGQQSIFSAMSTIFSSAAGAQPAGLDTGPTDPDLVYGEAGASVFSQLAGGGGTGGGAATAPAGDTTGGGAIGVPASGTTGGGNPRTGGPPQTRPPVPA
jgi:hypothetical protein